MRQSLQQLRQAPPKDEAARRLIDQIERETSGPHDVLVVGARGELTKIDPDATRLDALAVPREVRTSGGTEKIPAVAVEVQAYCPVGRAR